MGKVFHGDDWPHLLDYAFAPVALALATFDARALVDSFAAEREPVLPFTEYDTNHGIRAIYALAIAAELALAVGVVAWALDRKRKTPWETCVAIAAVVAAWVPWLELWWGSVFYYGEVRDKQDLPWSVIHCGPIGATFFACYLISRVKLPWNSELVRILVRATMFVAVWPLQMELLSALARPWALDQS